MIMWRTVTWFVLVGGGLVTIILSVLLATPPIAIAVGIASVGIWIAFGVTTVWYFGIRRQVSAHVGSRWNVGEVLRHRVRTAERVNLQLALDWLQSQSGTVGPFGIRGLGESEEYDGPPLTPIEIVGLILSNPEPVAIVWEPFPTSFTETMHCAGNALYLLRVRDEPVCVLVQGRSSETTKPAVVQLLARNQEAARSSLDELLRLALEQSVYRGQVISIQRAKGSSGDLSVQFHDLGRGERDAIVLPGDVMSVIERNILSFFRHAEALRRAGQGTRHGVLLHGPPGTGKTLVTRYLATNVEATVLLVTGRQYALLRPTCQLARLLTPSLVILEDVDLIAADRRRNAHTPLLHELLDEMDGLSVGADIVFLLTTNRPETLEPALAARPGRVDQAIYFPLPDLECRRQLCQRFSSSLDVAGIDLEPLLLRTEGASPAFLKELFRRATLIAVERGERGERPALRSDDFERALRELVEAGGELTRRFLGFPAR
jgi:hypothetical protein